MNGSYAFPIKYMKTWENENIWLVFSTIAFVLLPWLSLLYLEPNIIRILIDIPQSVLSTLIISGFLFGIGMVLFTISLRKIGLGISFALNISSSTIIATLLPIIWLNPHRLITPFGLTEILALIFFCLAIITSYFASVYKMASSISASKTMTKNIFIGVMLGLTSGILTSAQGFSYAYSSTILKPETYAYSKMAVMNTPWLPIFTAAFVPYFLFFLFKNIKNKSLENLKLPNAFPGFVFCLVMGILYFGSLILFGYATSFLGEMGAVVAWPMLMIFIILSSNIWSFIHGEWRHATKKSYIYLSISIAALIMAIALLSIAEGLNK